MLNSSKWLQWACVVRRGSCKREVSIESWRQEAVLWYLNEMESDCAWHLAGLQWPLALCPCLLGQYHYTKLSDTQVCNLASSLPFVPLCLFNTNIHRVCRLVPVKCTHPHVLLCAQRPRSVPVTSVGTSARVWLYTLTPRFLPQFILPSLPASFQTPCPSPHSPFQKSLEVPHFLLIPHFNSPAWIFLSNTLLM